MTRQDLLLKILLAADGEPVTPAQLQKVAFLLGKQFASELSDDYYDFIAYDFGPFCADIYRDAERLECDGFATITINPQGGWRQYAATIKGLQNAPEDIPEPVASYISATMTWARSLSFQQLVKAIYAKFPEYRENSVFQDW